VKQEQIELITNSIQRRLESSGETDIPTKVIGELVMDALKELDRVAYLRFASVYKDFQETDDFRKFIDKNLNLKED
jgi:transcriptional repressor NrdR